MRRGEGTAAGVRAATRYWYDRYREDPTQLERAFARGVIVREVYETWKPYLKCG